MGGETCTWFFRYVRRSVAEREREGENFRNETLRDLAAILDDGGAGERERVY